MLSVTLALAGGGLRGQTRFLATLLHTQILTLLNTKHFTTGGGMRGRALGYSANRQLLSDSHPQLPKIHPKKTQKLSISAPSLEFAPAAAHKTDYYNASLEEDTCMSYEEEDKCLRQCKGALPVPGLA